MSRRVSLACDARDAHDSINEKDERIKTLEEQLRSMHETMSVAVQEIADNVKACVNNAYDLHATMRTTMTEQIKLKEDSRVVLEPVILSTTLLMKPNTTVSPILPSSSRDTSNDSIYWLMSAQYRQQAQSLATSFVQSFAKK